MNVRVILRTIAILIAVAAMVDPAWSISRPDPVRLVAIDLVAGDGAASVASLRSALPGWTVERREGTSQSIPCGPDERCVLIADGSIDAPLPGDLAHAVSLITIKAKGGPNVAIRSVVATSAHVAAAGILQMALQRTGSIGESAVIVRDGEAVVGSASHQWTDGDTATIDVPWWPLDGGARTLRVEVAEVAGETTTVDNVLDVGVPVRQDRVPVLVFDAQPSWGSTFVRRSIEDDARLRGEHRARVAPALTAGTTGAVLDEASLDRAPVAIIGDPDALTASDVALLERYVRVRGGSLILLPERRISGPIVRLLQGDWTEHLVPLPERVGPLQASELLRVSNLPPTASVIAHSANAPSIVSLPTGQGRVIVSGALDAWRFRDVAFDDFWRSVVLEAGLAGSALRIDVNDALATSGTRIPFVIRHRSFGDVSALEVAVSGRCGKDQAAPVRVWPAGRGEFSGELSVTGEACQLQARAGDSDAVAAIAVSLNPARGVEPTLTKYQRLITAAGGTAEVAGNEAAMARALVDSFAATSRDVSVRPMRETFWLFLFAGCLAAEWWLRRREGLR